MKITSIKSINKNLATILLSSFLFFYSFNAFTQNVRYVTDEIRVHLRAGPGTDFRIIHILKSRNKLDFIEAEGNWSKVRFGDMMGWVPSQYLIFTPTALVESENSNNLEEKINFQSTQDIIRMQQQAIEGLADENKNLLIEKNKLSRELDSLKKVSETFKELQDEKEKLLTRLVESENQTQLLENIHSSSIDSINKNWLFILIIISAMSFIIGIAISYIKRKKNRRIY